MDAGGSLAWLFSSDLDLLGTMRVEIPVFGRGRFDVRFRLDARTAIEKVSSDLVFEVRDLAYAAEAAGRFETRTGPIVLVAAGQRGLENVDAPGSAFVRWAGAGLESRAYRHPGATGLSWRASLATVLDERNVEADARVTADLRWLRRIGRFLVGADASVDAMVDGRDVRADLAAGPRLDVTFPGDRRVSFYARWLRERGPLGSGCTGLAVGFDVAEAAGAWDRAAPPDVGGAVALGAGDGRVARRLALRVLSPPFSGLYHAVLDVDGNVLTGAGADELYYRYELGVEREGAVRAGVYAHHRSNHRLREENDSVTSLNALEAGVESPGYARPGAFSEGGRHRGRLEYRFRAGAVLDATIDGSERWRARAGLAWIPFRHAARVTPIARAEAETGRGDRHSVSAGVLVTPGMEIRLERRHDGQYYGEDRTDLLLVASVEF